MALKAEVHVAQTRLSSTQGRLDETVTKLTELKKEAANMAKLNQLSSKQLADAARLSTHPEAAEVLQVDAAAATSANPVMPVSVSSPAPNAETVWQAARFPGTGKPTSKGLNSSLTLEPGLKNFWCVSCDHVCLCACFCSFAWMFSGLPVHIRFLTCVWLQVCRGFHVEAQGRHAGPDRVVWRAMGDVSGRTWQTSVCDR